MSTLSGETLKGLAINQQLLSGYVDDNFQPSSYDLRVGTIFFNGDIISASNPPKNGQEFIELKPSEIVTLLTLEEIKMPHDYSGTVFPLNSHSSKGLLILNPGYVDPGYEGPLTVCAINLSTEPKIIALDEKIFTLVVNVLDKEVEKKQRYKNKPFKDRKDREKKLYQERFRNLSKSIFDLVVEYDNAKTILAEKLLKIFGWFATKTFTIAVAVLGLIGTLYKIFPNSPVFGGNSGSREQTDSLLIKDKDSIILKKDFEIMQLKDSIEDIKTSVK